MLNFRYLNRGWRRTPHRSRSRSENAIRYLGRRRRRHLRHTLLFVHLNHMRLTLLHLTERVAGQIHLDLHLIEPRALLGQLGVESR